MKKILFLIALVMLTSCYNKDKYYGTCKYMVKNNIFSSEKEIEIVDDYSTIDAYSIILSEIIEDDSEKELIIKLSETNIKYIKKEDVKYIHENGDEISYNDNIFSIIRKCDLVANRLNQK